MFSDQPENIMLGSRQQTKEEQQACLKKFRESGLQAFDPSDARECHLFESKQEVNQMAKSEGFSGPFKGIFQQFIDEEQVLEKSQTEQPTKVKKAKKGVGRAIKEESGEEGDSDDPFAVQHEEDIIMSEKRDES